MCHLTGAMLRFRVTHFKKRRLGRAAVGIWNGRNRMCGYCYLYHSLMRVTASGSTTPPWYRAQQSSYGARVSPPPQGQDRDSCLTPKPGDVFLETDLLPKPVAAHGMNLRLECPLNCVCWTGNGDRGRLRMERDFVVDDGRKTAAGTEWVWIMDISTWNIRQEYEVYRRHDYYERATYLKLSRKR